MDRQETTGTVIIAGFVLLLLWLLQRGSTFLHESVTSSIVKGGIPVSAQGTLGPDPVTGCPQFDSSIPETFPATWTTISTSIPPIDANGTVTPSPSDPKGASCPVGTTLWKDAHSGTYWCL